MNTDKRGIGDRVNLSDIPDNPLPGALPHPQGGLSYDPFATAQDTKSQFRPADPLYEAQQKAVQSQVAPPVQPTRAPTETADKVTKRPVPTVTQASRRETDMLRKFREVLSIRRVRIVDVTISRVDPQDPSNVLDVHFGLRGLNFEDYQWVLEKSIELQQHPAMISLAFKLPFVAMGVAAIGVGNDTPRPVWEVLGFSPEDPKHVADPMYPHIGLRFAAAEAMLAEFNETFFDTIEELYSKYESSVDSQYLPKKAKNAAKPVTSNEEATSEPPLAQNA